VTSTIHDRALRIIAEHFPEYREPVSDATTFATLGADSLDSIEITMKFEEAFQCEIDDSLCDEIGGTTTVGAVIGMLVAQIQKQAA
jgi:acyl carrier protein